jgi:tRNA threonylcarbamoyladenosine biosynthesis protein TsaE
VNNHFTYTLETINEAAQWLLHQLNTANIILLNGDLGAGKTTLTQTLCKIWQVQDTPSSPTFSIMNQYQTKQGAAIFHIDLYRIKSFQEAINTGIDEALYSNQICIVEWASLYPKLFHELNTQSFYIHNTSPNQRTIEQLNQPQI